MIHYHINHRQLCRENLKVDLYKYMSQLMDSGILEQWLHKWLNAHIINT